MLRHHINLIRHTFVFHNISDKLSWSSHWDKKQNYSHGAIKSSVCEGYESYQSGPYYEITATAYYQQFTFYGSTATRQIQRNYLILVTMVSLVSFTICSTYFIIMMLLLLLLIVLVAVV